MSIGPNIPKPLKRAIAAGQADDVARLAQDHNDVILKAAFEWAECNKHNLGASVLANQIKIPNASLRSKWNEMFIRACADQPWENVQNWMKVVDTRSYKVETGILAAIEAGQVETVQQMMDGQSIHDDALMISSVVSSGRPEMVRLVLECYPRDDITCEFLASFSIHTKKLGLMTPEMIDFLAGYFDIQEINQAWQFAEKTEYPLVDDNTSEQSRDFFAALLARQQQLAITQEIDHTPHMVRRAKM